MGSRHGQGLHLPGGSAVHRARAHLKILVLLGFVLLVVATPRDWFWVFGVHLAVVAGVVLVARLPLLRLLRRMVVEVPFLVFAALLPFVAGGPRVEVLGISVSEPGLLGAWALLAKGTLGVLASLTLAATTSPQQLLLGLERLRLPQQLVQIIAFMVRYVEVVGAEMQRMRIARESRGFVARDPRQWPVVARSLGALFIRSYERGERVHLAMLSRGYTGRMPR